MHISAVFGQDRPHIRQQQLTFVIRRQPVFGLGCPTLLASLPRAQRSERPFKRLFYSDVALAPLRLSWRPAHDWQLVSSGQFEHGARLMDEAGMLLGAWPKAAKANARRASLP